MEEVAVMIAVPSYVGGREGTTTPNIRKAQCDNKCNNCTPPAVTAPILPPMDEMEALSSCHAMNESLNSPKSKNCFMERGDGENLE